MAIGSTALNIRVSTIYTTKQVLCVKYPSFDKVTVLNGLIFNIVHGSYTLSSLLWILGITCAVSVSLCIHNGLCYASIREHI